MTSTAAADASVAPLRPTAVQEPGTGRYLYLAPDDIGHRLVLLLRKRKGLNDATAATTTPAAAATAAAAAATATAAAAAAAIILRSRPGLVISVARHRSIQAAGHSRPAKIRSSGAGAGTMLPGARCPRVFPSLFGSIRNFFRPRHLPVETHCWSCYIVYVCASVEGGGGVGC